MRTQRPREARTRDGHRQQRAALAAGPPTSPGRSPTTVVDAGASAENLPHRLASLSFGVPLIVVLLLRWIPPPTTAFMVQSAQAHADAPGWSGTGYRWTAWNEIAPFAGLAVIAAEDQRFPEHLGFDIDAIRAALDDAMQGERLRGASTISQQTVKNLFLWPGRSAIRKGLEAALTVLLELCWSKRRILEVYLNIAEFGDGLSASRRPASASSASVRRARCRRGGAARGRPPEPRPAARRPAVPLRPRPPALDPQPDGPPGRRGADRVARRSLTHALTGALGFCAVPETPCRSHVPRHSFPSPRRRLRRRRRATGGGCTSCGAVCPDSAADPPRARC